MQHFLICAQKSFNKCVCNKKWQLLYSYLVIGIIMWGKKIQNDLSSIKRQKWFYKQVVCLRFMILAKMLNVNLWQIVNTRSLFLLEQLWMTSASNQPRAIYFWNMHSPLSKPKRQKCHLCSCLKKNIKILHWLWKEKLLLRVFPVIPSSSRAFWQSAFLASVLSYDVNRKAIPFLHKTTLASSFAGNFNWIMSLCLWTRWFWML